MIGLLVLVLVCGVVAGFVWPRLRDTEPEPDPARERLLRELRRHG